MEKQWYSPAEFAAIVGRAAYTVREWCRTERIIARKRACGRGRSKEWEINCTEISFYLNHGLRPSPYAK
ncbi:hypothetical protein DTL42_19670 [Bremerella cremea]|uniref:Helix-turn-helix domain-containing protein n=1 Tax=Bremerella cremea TaxID=1031537 RepID=A0A368KLG1_9BACT|nr:hypothetical protein DTL42_19670 [Bremerella cremea]